MTALHWAAFSGNIKAVDELVKNGANVNMKDRVSSGALLMFY